MKPHAFLFDIGNVLLRFDIGLAVQKLAAKSDIHDPAEVLLQIDRIKVPYEEGKIGRESFLRAAIDVVRFRGTEAEFVAAWEDIFEANTPMMTLVESLRGRFPLYLLSNTNDIHHEYLFRHYPVFGHFAGGVYSYSAGASKPEEAIFRRAMEQFGLEPGNTFFIDDLLPNIETARKLGFQTHHYHHERHADCVQALIDLEVLPPEPKMAAC